MSQVIINLEIKDAVQELFLENVEGLVAAYLASLHDLQIVWENLVSTLDAFRDRIEEIFGVDIFEIDEEDSDDNGTD